MNSPFPPALLVDGRRLPGNAETFRRWVRALDVQPGERVLLIGAGGGNGLKVLAREHGATVTALEWEPGLVAVLEARVRDESLAGRVTVRSGNLESFAPGSFDVVLVDAPLPRGALTATAQQLRGLLATNGRLGLILPAAIGLRTEPAAAGFWSNELGMPLVRPTALLGQVERAGYEPIWAEALSEEVMAEFFRKAEALLPHVEASLGERMRKAAELFEGGARTSVAHVMLVARRREPGEKPPAARTAG